MCLSESLLAAELASHFQRFLISFLLSSPKQKAFSGGICIISSYFPACCGQSEWGKSGTFDLDSHTHTHMCWQVFLLYVVCCKSHFRTKGERRGSTWRVKKTGNAVKGGQKKWVRHFPAQSHAPYCFQSDTLQEQKSDPLCSYCGASNSKRPPTVIQLQRTVSQFYIYFPVDAANKFWGPNCINALQSSCLREPFWTALEIISFQSWFAITRGAQNSRVQRSELQGAPEWITQCDQTGQK